LSYTWEFGKQFAVEFGRYPENQQDKILDFTDVYEEGKISPSWRGIDKTDPIYNYTYSNNLWHYHIGIPDYVKSKYNNYLTSDMILHFQRKQQIDHIRLVDITWHYKANGMFWLPSPEYLE